MTTVSRDATIKNVRGSANGAVDERAPATVEREDRKLVDSARALYAAFSELRASEHELAPSKVAELHGRGIFIDALDQFKSEYANRGAEELSMHPYAIADVRNWLRALCDDLAPVLARVEQKRVAAEIERRQSELIAAQKAAELSEKRATLAAASQCDSFAQRDFTPQVPRPVVTPEKEPPRPAKIPESKAPVRKEGRVDGAYQSPNISDGRKQSVDCSRNGSFVGATEVFLSALAVTGARVLLDGAGHSIALKAFLADRAPALVDRLFSRIAHPLADPAESERDDKISVQIAIEADLLVPRSARFNIENACYLDRRGRPLPDIVLTECGVFGGSRLIEPPSEAKALIYRLSPNHSTALPTDLRLQLANLIPRLPCLFQPEFEVALQFIAKGDSISQRAALVKALFHQMRWNYAVSPELARFQHRSRHHLLTFLAASRLGNCDLLAHAAAAFFDAAGVPALVLGGEVPLRAGMKFHVEGHSQTLPLTETPTPFDLTALSPTLQGANLVVARAETRPILSALSGTDNPKMVRNVGVRLGELIRQPLNERTPLGLGQRFVMTLTGQRRRDLPPPPAHSLGRRVAEDPARLALVGLIAGRSQIIAGLKTAREGGRLSETLEFASSMQSLPRLPRADMLNMGITPKRSLTNPRTMAVTLEAAARSYRLLSRSARIALVTKIITETKDSGALAPHKESLTPRAVRCLATAVQEGLVSRSNLLEICEIATINLMTRLRVSSSQEHRVLPVVRELVALLAATRTKLEPHVWPHLANLISEAEERSYGGWEREGPVAYEVADLLRSAPLEAILETVPQLENDSRFAAMSDYLKRLEREAPSAAVLTRAWLSVVERRGIPIHGTVKERLSKIRQLTGVSVDLRTHQAETERMLQQHIAQFDRVSGVSINPPIPARFPHSALLSILCPKDERIQFLNSCWQIASEAGLKESALADVWPRVTESELVEPLKQRLAAVRSRVNSSIDEMSFEDGFILPTLPGRLGRELAELIPKQSFGPLTRVAQRAMIEDSAVKRVINACVRDNPELQRHFLTQGFTALVELVSGRRNSVQNVLWLLSLRRQFGDRFVKVLQAAYADRVEVGTKGCAPDWEQLVAYTPKEVGLDIPSERKRALLLIEIIQRIHPEYQATFERSLSSQLRDRLVRAPSDFGKMRVWDYYFGSPRFKPFESDVAASLRDVFGRGAGLSNKKPQVQRLLHSLGLDREIQFRGGVTVGAQKATGAVPFRDIDQKLTARTGTLMVKERSLYEPAPFVLLLSLDSIMHLALEPEIFQQTLTRAACLTAAAYENRAPVAVWLVANGVREELRPTAGESSSHFMHRVAERCRAWHSHMWSLESTASWKESNAFLAPTDRLMRGTLVVGVSTNATLDLNCERFVVGRKSRYVSLHALLHPRSSMGSAYLNNRVGLGKLSN